MSNKKNVDEIIKNLKKELKEARETIAFLTNENSTTKTKLAEQGHFIQTANTILSRLPGSIYWKGQNGVYLGCSDDMCNFLGMSREQIIGHNDDYIGQVLGWPKEISAKAMKDDCDVIFNNAPRLNTEEIPFSDKNGKIIHLMTSKVPLLDNSGEVIGVLGFSVDITERKHMEEDLKKAKEAAEAADVAKTEFIANMSHDIRTPLTGVVGMAQILEDGLQEPKQKEYAHALGDSGHQLLKMLNEILNAIAAENVDTHDLQEDAFNLHELLHDITQLEQPSITVKGLELITEIDPNIPPILISDQKKLHHILLNLVGNSVKFTQEGYIKIKITLLNKETDKVNLKFDVIDTGIGIESDMLDKVFERFFRVTPSYKGKHEGHGLGLHIAQSYVELLGGKFQVVSEPNKGSVFSFQLVLKIGNEQAFLAETAKRTHEALLKTPVRKPSATVVFHELPADAPRVLLIEDNPVALTVVESIINQAQLASVTAMDGESALELAKIRSFDLIISDIGLPGMSGLEFTQQLRAWEKEQGQKSVPIIGLTAHAEHTIRDECIVAGMNDVKTKPLTHAMLGTLMAQFSLTGATPPSDVQSMMAPPATSLRTVGKLGLDLPDTEIELFDLQTFSILDAEQAIKDLGGNRDLFIAMLKTMLNDEIPKERAALEAAYGLKDWGKIEKLAHKMKGGAVYLKLLKLSHACQYLERYRKAGHSKLLEKLYQQMLKVMDETRDAIRQWFRDEQ